MDPVGDDVVEQPLVVGDDEHRPVRAPQRVDAVGDDAQGVDVEARVGLVQDGERRLEDGHLEDLVALLLAAGEPLVDRAAHEAPVHLDERHLLLGEREELHRVELVEPALAAERVERGAQEVEVADAGDLDRVLEGEEDPRCGPLLGRHGEQVLALVADLAGDLVGLVAGEHVGEGALARAVRAHDRVHLARLELEGHAPEDLGAADPGVEVSICEHQPTLPSRLTLRSRWASTANSMGSSLNTSRQKPFTIIEMASSSAMPRWRQ